jgi:hypothetical protein
MTTDARHKCESWISDEALSELLDMVIDWGYKKLGEQEEGELLPKVDAPKAGAKRQKKKSRPKD